MILFGLLTTNRILASVPLATFLVLFDLVVDNPTHLETAANLAMLDVGGGHFSGLEYSSQGTLPGSIASEFAQMARTYVREQEVSEINRGVGLSDMPASGITSSAGLLESVSSEASLASVSYTDLQPFPLGWNLRNDDGAIPEAEMLDLFGSFYPLWDDSGTYNALDI